MILKTIKSVCQLSLLLLASLLTIVSGCQDNASLQKNNKQAAKVTNRGNHLKLIKNRGKLICGINDELPGFSFKEKDGSYTGISVDICRALAVALFDDPAKVEFRHLSSEKRFAAVESGQVDLLSRNTTWTLSRDTSEGLEFPPTTFYDGLGLLVGKASGIDNIEDLEGKSICVATGTTAEENLAEQMRRRSLSYIPVPFEDSNQMYAAYEAKSCDAAISDRSELVARRAGFKDPDPHKVLEEALSKEPLGSVIANNQPEWFDVVKWVTYAMIKAEELGISSQNIDNYTQTKNHQIRRFMGVEGNLGEDIGLSNDFAKRVIKQVGNYEEIYDRNIGQPFSLKRGTNALWKDGGLIYAPPFR